MNGQFVGESHDWQAQPIFDIKKFVHAGDNVIAVGVNNGVGSGGLNPNVNVQNLWSRQRPPWSRSLFNGLAQVIVQSTTGSWRIQIDGDRPMVSHRQRQSVQTQPCAPRPAVP